MITPPAANTMRTKTATAMKRRYSCHTCDRPRPSLQSMDCPTTNLTNELDADPRKWKADHLETTDDLFKGMRQKYSGSSVKADVEYILRNLNAIAPHCKLDYLADSSTSPCTIQHIYFPPNSDYKPTKPPTVDAGTNGLPTPSTRIPGAEHRSLRISLSLVKFAIIDGNGTKYETYLVRYGCPEYNDEADKMACRMNSELATLQYIRSGIGRSPKRDISIPLPTLVTYGRVTTSKVHGYFTIMKINSDSANIKPLVSKSDGLQDINVACFTSLKDPVHMVQSIARFQHNLCKISEYNRNYIDDGIGGVGTIHPNSPVKDYFVDFSPSRAEKVQQINNGDSGQRWQLDHPVLARRTAQPISSGPYRAGWGKKPVWRLWSWYSERVVASHRALTRLQDRRKLMPENTKARRSSLGRLIDQAVGKLAHYLHQTFAENARLDLIDNWTRKLKNFVYPFRGPVACHCLIETVNLVLVMGQITGYTVGQVEDFVCTSTQVGHVERKKVLHVLQMYGKDSNLLHFQSNNRIRYIIFTMDFAYDNPGSRSPTVASHASTPSLLSDSGSDITIWNQDTTEEQIADLLEKTLDPDSELASDLAAFEKEERGRRKGLLAVGFDRTLMTAEALVTKIVKEPQTQRHHLFDSWRLNLESYWEEGDQMLEGESTYFGYGLHFGLQRPAHKYGDEVFHVAACEVATLQLIRQSTTQVPVVPIRVPVVVDYDCTRSSEFGPGLPWILRRMDDVRGNNLWRNKNCSLVEPDQHEGGEPRIRKLESAVKYIAKCQAQLLQISKELQLVGIAGIIGREKYKLFPSAQDPNVAFNHVQIPMCDERDLVAVTTGHPYRGPDGIQAFKEPYKVANGPFATAVEWFSKRLDVLQNRYLNHRTAIPLKNTTRPNTFCAIFREVLEIQLRMTLLPNIKAAFNPDDVRRQEGVLQHNCLDFPSIFHAGWDTKEQDPVVTIIDWTFAHVVPVWRLKTPMFTISDTRLPLPFTGQREKEDLTEAERGRLTEIYEEEMRKGAKEVWEKIEQDAEWVINREFDYAIQILDQ
ncbi:hypothetical protein BJ508DRAFT_311859 [Ascobolus immersus RN42]|uniref:Aminoglycoside phosphotransferase domain-containing protein n=1 Tax=Ascobolus immersus RN42 TaxID=1160509 RepID=A0A3N4HUQ5_ASCIM|nr:hypothetical protein BJ508DRAFT_311859 [Ascobolus immersus RN42]